MPHLEVDLERFLHNLDAVHPDVERMLVSARTGEGVDAWRAWLAELVAARSGARRVTAAASPGAVRERVERRLAERREAGEALFEPRAARLARLCHRMAERFARGGRLRGDRRHSPPARSDARHVAVEFVHPVIVGKRALPAIGLTGECGPLAARARPARRARRHRASPSASRPTARARRRRSRSRASAAA